MWMRMMSPNFALKGADGILPAGDYRILTHEELIDGLSFLAYPRVATLIFPLAVGGFRPNDDRRCPWTCRRAGTGTKRSPTTQDRA
jgi:hypothetical protein